jgi:hypothetical protein
MYWEEEKNSISPYFILFLTQLGGSWPNTDRATNCKCHHHQHQHHQSNNVPTAGAQNILMEDIKRTGHNLPREPSAGWCVLTTANAARTNGLTCLPKDGGARDNKYKCR